MNRSFARKLSTPSRGTGAIYDSGDVKISSTKLFAGGIAAATGGVLTGMAIQAVLKPAIATSAAAMLGPLAIIPGAALIGIGYYTLWTGGDKLEV